MELYNIMHILTNVIFTYSLYQFFHAFVGNDTINKKYEYLSYILFFIISSGLVFITRMPIVNFLFIIIALFLLAFNYGINLQRKFIIAIFICALLLIIELVLSVTLGFIDISAFKNDAYYSLSTLVLIRVITLIISRLLNRYNSALKKDFSIPIFYYLAILIIMCGSLYLFVLTLERTNINIYSLYLSCLILAVVNVTVVVLDEQIYKFILISNEKNIIEQQNIAYENQIELINQSNEIVRIIKHDMINHLIILNNLYESNKNSEIKPYISNLMQDFKTVSYSNSNNFVINSIINFKLGVLQKEKLNISLNINVPNNSNISAKDLTSVIGNLLDNAIYAMMESEEKILDITIISKMNNLILLIDNSYNGNLLYEKGRFKTTKPFDNSHGFGLISVKKILDKYDGEIQTTFTEKIFSVSVVIPDIQI